MSEEQSPEEAADASSRAEVDRAEAALREYLGQLARVMDLATINIGAHLAAVVSSPDGLDLKVWTEWHRSTSMVLSSQACLKATVMDLVPGDVVLSAGILAKCQWSGERADGSRTEMKQAFCLVSRRIDDGGTHKRMFRDWTPDGLAGDWREATDYAPCCFSATLDALLASAFAAMIEDKTREVEARLGQAE